MLQLPLKTGLLAFNCLFQREKIKEFFFFSRIYGKLKFIRTGLTPNIKLPI